MTPRTGEILALLALAVLGLACVIMPTAPAIVDLWRG